MVASLPGLRIGLNCTIELDSPDAEGEELKSRIEDMQGDEIVVSWPTKRGQNVHVAIGDMIFLSVPTAGATLYLDGEVSGRQMSGGMPLLVIRVLAVGRQQNRQHYRLRLSLQPLDCAVWERDFGRSEAEGQWRPISATVADISGGGIGLISDDQVASGARMRLRMPYPAGTGELIVDLRVAVCKTTSASARFMIGTQYESLDRVERERLLRSIHRYQVEQKRRENARMVAR